MIVEFGVKKRFRSVPKCFLPFMVSFTTVDLLIVFLSCVLAIYFDGSRNISCLFLLNTVIWAMLLIFIVFPLTLYFWFSREENDFDFKSKIQILEDAVETNQSAYDTMFLGLDRVVVNLSYYHYNSTFRSRRVFVQFESGHITTEKVEFDNWQEVEELFENPAKFAKVFENPICWVTGAPFLHKRVAAEV